MLSIVIQACQDVAESQTIHIQLLHVPCLPTKFPAQQTRIIEIEILFRLVHIAHAYTNNKTHTKVKMKHSLTHCQPN
jgi:hypothetical protein